MYADMDIKSLCFLFLVGASGAATAASVPDELIGSWSEINDDFCGIEFKPKGFNGSADGEGYGCIVKSVRVLSEPLSQTPTWSIVFVCEGEFGKIQMTSLIHLRTIKGIRMMARADSLGSLDAKKADVAPLSLLFKCK
jgi:hypothetical protein